MKRVIEGLTYNSETATEIGRDSNVASVGLRDFSWYRERLYVTAKGRYFLHGDGGPYSRWGESLGRGSRCEGESIEALTPLEARCWCEDHDVDADVIAKYFAVEEA
jgi:hypothetical protein